MQRIDRYNRRRAIAITAAIAFTGLGALALYAERSKQAPTSISLETLKTNPGPYENSLIQTEGYVLSSLPTGIVSFDSAKRSFPHGSIVLAEPNANSTFMQTRQYLTAEEYGKAPIPTDPNDLYRRVTIRGVIVKIKDPQNPGYFIEVLEIQKPNNKS